MNSHTQTDLITVTHKLKKTCAIILVATMTALMVTPAFAVSKTTTLVVSNITCSACPITVKKALFGVHGVEKVTFNLDRKEAVITFDDAQTNVKALTKATANAGYPATVKE